GILPRHAGRITTLSYSADGQYLLSASTDNTILRTRVDGSEAVRLSENFGEVHKIAFSDDGRYAVLGTETGVKIWDLDLGTLSKSLNRNTQQVWNIAISPDGSKVAVGGMDYVGIYDLSDGSYRQLSRTSNMVSGLAFSPDGGSLAIAAIGEPATLRTLEGSIQTTFPASPDQSFTELAFTPDGKFLITGESRGAVKRWRLDASYSDVLKLGGTMIRSLTVRSAYEILAGDMEGILYAWDQPGKEAKNYLLDRDMFLEAVALSPDRRHILAADNWGNLLVWPVPPGGSPELPVPDEITSLTILDSTQYLTGDLAGHIRLWKPGDSTLTVAEVDGAVNTLSYSTTTALVAIGNSFGEIIFIAPDGSNRRLVQTPQEEVQNLHFAPDGQSLLVSYGGFTDVQLLDLEGKVLQNFPGSSSADQAIFSPDGKLVMTNSPVGGNAGALYRLDGSLISNNFTHQVFDSRQSRQVESGVLACAFTPDGKYIITSGGDFQIKIWDLEGNEIRSFSDGYLAWQLLTVSPDGQYVINFNYDGNITVWTIEGLKIQDFKMDNQVNALAFSPDSRYIWTAGAGGYPQKIALWKTVLEKSPISRIELYESGALADEPEDAVEELLKSEVQAELIDYGAYFQQLYYQDNRPEYLDYMRRLYGKALSPTLEKAPDAYSLGWWERHLSVQPGDRPGISELKLLFEELKGQLR
ncbi:MAG: WD40 repeat domain-containing protein, partial [Lewinella sp.]|nr:WD40 repeat domain-containing protein [Lewinella sp.]